MRRLFCFCQTPVLPSLANSLHLQLTGRELAIDLSLEEAKEPLRQACLGKDVLLVLDDVWDASHVAELNFIDDTTSSKVLLSTRVLSVLGAGCDAVEIGRPSTEEAVQMLLHAAGHSPDSAAVPAEAVSLVRVCKHLPLLIGMAGRIVKSMGLGVHDWSGVVELIDDELRGGGGGQSVEERVILASLNSIKGFPAVQHLFGAFAFIPEDTKVSLDLLQIVFRTQQPDVPSEAGDGLAQSQSRLQLRRMLRLLIDRSLVLPPIDSPSLHDIVLCDTNPTARRVSTVFCAPAWLLKECVRPCV